MRILIFTLTYHPFIGGAEVALAEITKRLPGVTFDLVTAKLHPELSSVEKKGNVTVYRVGRGNVFDKYFYPRMAAKFASDLIKKNGAEAYHTLWGMMATWGGWAALKTKDRHDTIPYLLTLQSGDSDRFLQVRTWFWQRRYRQIYRRADHIQAISTFLKDRAKRYGYQGKISIVPNGVDLDRFNNKVIPRSIKDIFKTQLPVVITVSRLVSKNGLADLINSVVNIQVNLLIIGTGKLEVKLKKQVTDLGLEDRIKFTGLVDHDELPGYLRASDIFCRPSLSEGFGISFLEAMACGVPVVAPQVGGIIDFLNDKNNGLACNPKDPASITRAFERLLGDRLLRQKIKAEGLRTAANYNWDQVAKQMEPLLIDVKKI